jgi:Cytochrome c554 and c-prime
MAICCTAVGFTEYPSAASGGQILSAPSARIPLEESNGFVGDLACRPCHQDKFTTYLATAHHRTSRLPEATSIAGSFTKGEDLMITFNPELTFQMDSHDGHFYQTAIVKKNGRTNKHTEEIDLVIGSATKGQTYLYWKQNSLFELPVSYWTELHRWVNSPGYVDGSADFDRPVVPRCLECHASKFQPVTSSPSENRYNRDNFALGISCERCHGPAMGHVAGHAANPAGSIPDPALPPLGLSRDRQIDVCAQCHGGAGQAVAPAFSFRPGRNLSDYVRLQQPDATDRLDVHGNQAILLKRSRCFQDSAEMTCSTCHDVHTLERPAADYSARCLGCHRADQCGMARKRGTQIASNCIDCHMPVQPSNKLVLDADNQRLQANVRTHWIRIYQNPSLP